MDIRKMVSEIKEKMDRAGGLKHVYFVACGGSKAAIFPGLYLLQSEAKGFGASTYTSNEFVHVKPKELDNRCIAVICSLKATPETVEANGEWEGSGYDCYDWLYGDGHGQGGTVCCYLFKWRRPDLQPV